MKYLALVILSSGVAFAEDAAPAGPPPMQQPPPPSVPPPPAVVGRAPPAAPSVARTAGQWVFTRQLGWIWMPYGDQFVSSPATASGQPFAFVYGPTLGWQWVSAPWVWGVGPSPYFGPFGPRRFHWYHGPSWHGRGRFIYRGGYQRYFAPHGHFRGLAPGPRLVAPAGPRMMPRRGMAPRRPGPTRRGWH
jgi:hypothetical protein